MAKKADHSKYEKYVGKMVTIVTDGYVDVRLNRTVDFRVLSVGQKYLNVIHPGPRIRDFVEYDKIVKIILLDSIVDA